MPLLLSFTNADAEFNQYSPIDLEFHREVRLHPLFPSEAATFGQSCLSTCWLAEHL